MGCSRTFPLSNDVQAVLSICKILKKFQLARAVMVDKFNVRVTVNKLCAVLVIVGKLYVVCDDREVNHFFRHWPKLDKVTRI